MTTLADVVPDRAEILDRARRAFWRRMALVPAMLVAGALGGVLFASRQDSFRDTWPILLVVLLGSFAVAALAIGLGYLAVKRRNGGRFDPPLTYGLTRDERRVVTRDLNRGVASDDPRLAAIEQETARSVVANSRVLWVYPIVALTQVPTLVSGSTGSRGRAALLVLSMIVTAVFVVRQQRAARRLLGETA